MSCKDCKDRYRCPDHDKAISVHCGAYDKTPAKFTWEDPRQEGIKPCPFCGGKAKLMLAMGEAWILCPECESSGPMSPSIERAVGLWNKRVANGPDWVALHDSLSKGMADLNEQCRRAMAEISQSIREAIQRGEE